MSAAAAEYEYEYEYKYTVSPGRAEAFLVDTDRELQPVVYDRRRPTAYARTTYLDTESLAYLHSSASPVQRRLRVREYASAPAPDEPALLTGDCFLELKLSEAGRRAKTRLRATPAEIAAFVERRGAVRFFGGDYVAASLLRDELRDVSAAPRVSVWYRRRSFRRDDQRVRVTVDTDIQFADPAAPHDVLGRGPECVLEIKHVGTPPDWLRDAMSSLGVPEPLSKYELGMHAVAGVRATPYRLGRRVRSKLA